MSRALQLDDAPEALSTAQAAEILQCSRSTVRELMARGDLSHIRLGRWVRIPRSSVARLLGRTLSPLRPREVRGEPVPGL